MLVGVMQLGFWAAFSMMLGASSVICADWRSFLLTVGVPNLLCSLAMPGVCNPLLCPLVAQACLSRS